MPRGCNISSAEDLGILPLLTLKASSAAMRLEKERLSKTQDRANVSCTVLSAHVVVLSEPGASPPVQSLMCSPASPGFPPLSGTAPSPPQCGQPQARGKDKDCPVTGRRLQFPFHSIIRRHAKTCSSVVWCKGSILGTSAVKLSMKAWCLLGLKVIEVARLVCLTC